MIKSHAQYVWGWLIQRGCDRDTAASKGQCVLNCHHLPGTSLCPLNCFKPKTLWKGALFLMADAGGQTGAGRSG